MKKIIILALSLLLLSCTYKEVDKKNTEPLVEEVNIEINESIVDSEETIEFIELDGQPDY